MTAQNNRIRHLVFSLTLCFASATVWALNTNQPPGGNFDLNHWKLQLPTSSGLLTCTNLGADEKTPAQLEAGFTNAYFYTGTDGAMVFWAPINGATTSGTHYPRSELREVINPSNDNINWIPYGTHILDAQCKVLQVPSSKKVIIGQIHADSSAALPTVKIYYNNGKAYGTVKTNSTDDTSDYTFPSVNVALSNSITYQIKVVNGLVSIAINNKTNSLNIFQSDRNYTNETQYFKAGDYCQDNSCSNPSTNLGARVAFYSVNLFHAPSITNQPASQIVSPGSNVTFTVGALGNPPLKYFWLFNGAPMSGKTNAALSIPNVQLTNAGNYSVIVTDFVGTVTSVVTSSVATLTVLSDVPPTGPTGLVATALSETQVRLTWTDRATNETTYGVGRSTDSNSWSVLTNSLPANSTNYTDATCSPSTLYYYRVNCTNVGGASPYAVVSLTTPAGVGDGIPGAWRLQYFGNGLTTNSTSCATCNPDGDSQNNQTEFLAGTDPTNSTSFWRIQANPTNGSRPLAVSFTENSTGSSITNRLWDFGDGASGSGSNPSHTYTNSGTFSVSETILNVYGTATLVAPNLVTVSPETVWTNANASGNWSAPTSWNPVNIPDSGADVIFASAGTTAVVDNVSRTVGQITFNRSGAFVVSAAGGASLAVNNGITINNNFTNTISAPVVLNGTNFWLVTTNGILQVSGPVSGTKSLTKDGSGTAILSGTNGYSGATIVSNGMLAISGAGLITNTPSIDLATNAMLDVSGRTSGSMTLVSGQALQGNGTILGKLILADGSTLSPGGNSAGMLTFLNDLVVSNAAMLQYDLGTNGDLTAVASNLTLGGTLNINDAGGLSTGVYTLVTYGGTLTFNGLAIGTTPNPNFLYVIDTNTAGQVSLNVMLFPTTIGIGAADLQDSSGNLAPANSVAVLVIDTGNNGFVDPQPGFALSVGATWGADDKVVGLWDLRDCSGNAGGALCAETVVPYSNGIAPGQTLQLYWFPSLTLSSNTLGTTSYGKYTDPIGIDGSDAWQMPEPGSSPTLWFFTASEGGSNPETAGQATSSTATVAPVAGFTASATSGTEPFEVVFTDTSSGSPLPSLFWDLGDSTTLTTSAGAGFPHTYAAGTYTVTLIASNSAGTSALVSNSLITVITAFQGLQLQYFSCTNCPEAQGNADPDGDGMSNTNEFLAGTDPTSSAAYLHIIRIVKSGNDINVTYLGANGDTNYAGGPSSRTNVLEYSTGSADGSYMNNFASAGQTNILSGGDGSGVVTNMVDIGGATNVPSRYYRVRVLVP